MVRLLALAFFLSAALPAQAQLRSFEDPAVWVTTSFGAVPWTSAALASTDRDNVVTSLGLSVASPRWMVQAGAQISSAVETEFDLAGILDPISAPGNDREAPVTYRTVYAVAGPWTTSEWFMAGAAVGPSLTWGTRVRDASPCLDRENLGEGFFCTPILVLERERYLNLGLAGSVQGFVRLDGRVWLGGETMLVANLSSTHLATRIAVRVDLLRPNR